MAKLTFIPNNQPQQDVITSEFKEKISADVAERINVHERLQEQKIKVLISENKQSKENINIANWKIADLEEKLILNEQAITILENRLNKINLILVVIIILDLILFFK